MTPDSAAIAFLLGKRKYKGTSGNFEDLYDREVWGSAAVVRDGAGHCAASHAGMC